jgi:hypothetical protein
MSTETVPGDAKFQRAQISPQREDERTRYGWLGGFGTYWYSDPTRDLIGLLLTPRVFGEVSPAPDFWKAVYQSLKA